MIRIMNMRKQKPRNEFDVRVDRWSILGNPFKMKTETERDLVCDKYETYFNNIISNNKDWLLKNGIDDEFRQDFIQELTRIQGIYKKYWKLNLFCWCYPRRCHSATIRNCLLNS